MQHSFDHADGPLFHTVTVIRRDDGQYEASTPAIPGETWTGSTESYAITQAYNDLHQRTAAGLIGISN